jgi:hypothetical protein
MRSFRCGLFSFAATPALINFETDVNKLDIADKR